MLVVMLILSAGLISSLRIFTFIKTTFLDMLIHIFNFFFPLKACGCKPQAGKEHGSVVSQLAHFHTGVHAGEGALAHVPRCAALL